MFKSYVRGLPGALAWYTVSFCVSYTFARALTHNRSE